MRCVYVRRNEMEKKYIIYINTRYGERKSRIRNNKSDLRACSESEEILDAMQNSVTRCQLFDWQQQQKVKSTRKSSSVVRDRSRAYYATKNIKFE